MKKHSFLMRLLLLFLLLATGSVSRLSAAESPSDSLFNAAYTDVQVLINEIDRTSQYYHYIPAVDPWPMKGSPLQKKLLPGELPPRMC